MQHRDKIVIQKIIEEMDMGKKLLGGGFFGAVS